MENIENKDMTNNSGKVWAGLIIVGIGALLLLDNLGLNLPHWLFKWSNILIVIGLFIGIKHNFKHSAWFIMVLVGSFFTLQDAFRDDINFGKIVFPGMIVILGLYLIFKPKSDFTSHKAKWKNKGDKWKRKFGEHDPFMASPETDPNLNPSEKKTSNNDYLDSVNVFGGSHQTIYSKNFKGGEVVAVFGGCDLNLSQADFEGEIIIDITAIFGGCKIILPAGWQVKQEVTAIFGGLDDKRSVVPNFEGPHKLVIIRGIAMFGGVDIRNF